MKPFNLEEAKAGKPVCTKDGKFVRIICFNSKKLFRKNPYPIVALISIDGDEELIESYTLNGKYDIDGNSDLDLMMSSTKYEGYINLYKNKDKTPFKNFPGCNIYNSEQAAKEASETISDDSQYVTTIKIEWEE